MAKEAPVSSAEIPNFSSGGNIQIQGIVWNLNDPSLKVRYIGDYLDSIVAPDGKVYSITGRSVNGVFKTEPITLWETSFPEIFSLWVKRVLNGVLI